MNEFYQVTENARNYLLEDENINTVSINLADLEDLRKQTIYPHGNLIVGNATKVRGTWEFALSVVVADIVDVNKRSNEEKTNQSYKGQDNKQDVLNTMLSVCENFEIRLRRNASENGYNIIGNMVCEPFEDKFTNVITGWMATFDLSVPINITICP